MNRNERRAAEAIAKREIGRLPKSDRDRIEQKTLVAAASQEALQAASASAQMAGALVDVRRSTVKTAQELSQLLVNLGAEAEEVTEANNLVTEETDALVRALRRQLDSLRDLCEKQSRAFAEATTNLTLL